MADGLKRDVFGTTKTGETVHRVEISGGGLTAKVITWGAVIQDLRLEGHDAPLTLGFDDFDSYPAHSAYFGATPGRNANRIGGGKFTLEMPINAVERMSTGTRTLECQNAENITLRRKIRLRSYPTRSCPWMLGLLLTSSAIMLPYASVAPE